MWKQQQQATTTCEIHFSSCFFFDLLFRPISRQNPEPSNFSRLARQALLRFQCKQNKNKKSFFQAAASREEIREKSKKEDIVEKIMK